MDSATEKRVYVCLSDQVMAEYDVPVASGSPTLKLKYAYGEYIDEPVVQWEVDGAAEEAYWYHQDALYSVVAVTNRFGIPVSRAAYDAYGNPTTFSSPSFDVNGDGTIDNGELTSSWATGGRALVLRPIRR